MKFTVVLILSVICLLINLNMADAANFISGNNNINRQQTSSTSVVIDGKGKDNGLNLDDDIFNFGADNVISGSNNHKNVQTNVKSTIHIDKNGNRQETRHTNINQNDKENSHQHNNGGGDNVIIGNNKNNVQSSIKTTVSDKKDSEDSSTWKKIKGWFKKE